MLDTSITDAAFEDDLMERARPRPRTRQTCETCAHYGCCDGLPHCSWSCWVSAFSKCDQCGCEFRDEGEWQSEDGHTFCSEACMDDWCEEHPNEEAEDGE